MLAEAVPLARSALSAGSPLLRRLGVTQLSRTLQASLPASAHSNRTAPSAAPAADPSDLLVEVLSMLRDADTGTAAAAQTAVASMASLRAGGLPNIVCSSLTETAVLCPELLHVPCLHRHAGASVKRRRSFWLVVLLVYT